MLRPISLDHLLCCQFRNFASSLRQLISIYGLTGTKLNHNMAPVRTISASGNAALIPSIITTEVFRITGYATLEPFPELKASLPYITVFALPLSGMWLGLSISPASHKRALAMLLGGIFLSTLKRADPAGPEFFTSKVMMCSLSGKPLHWRVLPGGPILPCRKSNRIPWLIIIFPAILGPWGVSF